MIKWSFIFTIFLQFNFLLSQTFIKNQYQDDLKLFSNNLKEAQNSFKDLNKELNKRFPSEGQNSIYYKNIIDDFDQLKNLLNDIELLSKNLESFTDNYQKSFGQGKSKKDKITSDDENFKKIEDQSNIINDSFNSANDYLIKIEILKDFFIENFRQIDEIKDLVKSSEKELISFNREIEKSKNESKKIINEYNNTISLLINFPIYEKGIGIRDEFINFEENITILKKKLEENENNLKSLYSGTSKVYIDDPFQYYEKLKKNQSDLILKVRDGLEEIPNKRIFMNGFQNDIDIFRKDLLSSKTELEKFIRPTFRNIDQVSLDIESTNKNFQNISTDFQDFPIVINGKIIDDSLKIMKEKLLLTKDSLGTNLKKYERFLSGKYSPEGKATHIETFDFIKNDVVKLKDLSNLQLIKIDSTIEILIDISKLIDEFKDEIVLMDEKIFLLEDSITVNKEIFNLDSIRYNSLVNKISKEFSIEVFPYLELKNSFDQMEKKIYLIITQFDSLIFLKKSFIKHVSTMKSIRNEKEKYDIFKNFLSDFNNLNKSSLEEVSNFKKLNINFKNNVITNFKNTTEYWSIIYKSNNDSNETSFTENFGYLIDLNRYPVPQYYGQLISDYQIKLIREKNKYKINFLTSSDLPIRGFQILSLKNQVLIESSFDQWQEIDIENIKYFSSLVDVSVDSLSLLINAESHILKILFVSMENKINLTRYETKIYKKYKIPDKRLRVWANQLNINN